MSDLVGAVSGDLLEIGDASEKEGQVQALKCKGESERIQEEGWGVRGIGPRGGIGCDQSPF